MTIIVNQVWRKKWNEAKNLKKEADRGHFCPCLCCNFIDPGTISKKDIAEGRRQHPLHPASNSTLTIKHLLWTIPHIVS